MSRLAILLSQVPGRMYYGVRAALRGPEPDAAYLRHELAVVEGLLRAAVHGREVAERERDALAAEVAALRARRAYLDAGPVVRRGADDTLESE